MLRVFLSLEVLVFRFRATRVHSSLAADAVRLPRFAYATEFPHFSRDIPTERFASSFPPRVLCTEAERILGETDPGSVVVDEIIALPICFLPWVAREYLRLGQLPSPEVFFTGSAILGSAGIFLLFRVFDIAKPWPVRQSQRLPAGFGVTIDDCLAAVYVALVSLCFLS